MNLFRLSLKNLRANPLNTGLNVLLLALGIATITLLLLFAEQLQDRLTRNAKGIDLVVGAKGSPLQLILSAVYHADAPTGNIPLAEADKLRQQPLVAKAVPISLGDSYKGFRIVGTERGYLDFYNAKLAQGAPWTVSMEAVLGAEVAKVSGLKVGDSFYGSHGLVAGGHAHDDNDYVVTGILQPTGSVADKLVLTSLQSVWDTHESEKPTAMGKATGLAQSDDDPEAHREVTAMLIQFKNPLALMFLPRQINSQTNLQAAAPVIESARLLQIVGFGLDAFRAFAILLIVSAGLGVFVALYNTLKERRFDLAVMRLLGANRGQLFLAVLLEGLLLALLAAGLGLALGHGFAEALGHWLGASQSLTLTGALFLPEELWLLALALLVGLVAALLPAIQAWRTDIAIILSDQ